MILFAVLFSFFFFSFILFGHFVTPPSPFASLFAADSVGYLNSIALQFTPVVVPVLHSFISVRHLCASQHEERTHTHTRYLLILGIYSYFRFLILKTFKDIFKNREVEKNLDMKGGICCFFFYWDKTYTEHYTVFTSSSSFSSSNLYSQNTCVCLEKGRPFMCVCIYVFKNA